MATIKKDRIYAYGGARMGQGAPRYVWFPVAASQTANPGVLAKIVSNGVVTLTSLSTNTDIAGVLEERITTAKSSGDLVPVTFANPNAWFEATILGAPARAALSGTVHPWATDSDIGAAVIRNAVSGTASIDGCTVINLLSSFDYFETHRYISKSGTSETSGTDNYPAGSKAGVVGDTAPRVVFQFGNASIWN